MAPQRNATTIRTPADIQAGIAVLRRACPHMRRLHDLVGDPPLRRHRRGFEGLARAVVGQQLSAASAAAIWGRTFAAVQPFDAARFLAADDETLRAAGLSRGKVRTLRTISEAVSAGALNLAALDRAPEEKVREALVAINGVGPWTADIYLLFCLGRGDAFAPGDLALKLAVKSALALEAAPSNAELEAIAERWRPWRAVAARLLWAFYAFEKSGQRNPI